MSFDAALDAAAAGQRVLIVDPDISAAEIAAAWKARALHARDLCPGGGGIPAPSERLVVGGAEALAGVVRGSYCGPWDLIAALEPTSPRGVLLLTGCRHPAVAGTLERTLGLQGCGELDEGPPGANVETVDVTAALAVVPDTGWVVTDPAHAEVLQALALSGHLAAVRRAPFLVEVADDRRFKRPFVEADPRVEVFFSRHDAFVSGLGMLESAQYRFHGRQPKDLRVLAEALGRPLHELVTAFRVMDHHGVVVSAAVDVGAAAGRINLVVEGSVADVDVQAATADVGALLALRGQLGLVDEHEDAPDDEEAMDSSGDVPVATALFASLSALSVPDDEPSMDDEPSEEPAPAAPEALPMDLPDHLPGLDALARGDLQVARDALAVVEGALRDEALLLGAFRYEVIDADGVATRRFTVPAQLQTVALRALELEAVPTERVRTALDEAFPDAFVEVPRPGLIEAFYDSGEFAGTHRLQELPGRVLFERPHLTGARAVQQRLVAGEHAPGDAGDEGWARLAEVLRLRDAGEAEAAWELLDGVDVDVELDGIRRSLVDYLPADHPERVEVERLAAEERLRRALGPVQERMEAALEARGRQDGDGYEAIELARKTDVLGPLLDFLARAADDAPEDPGPPLWIARIRAEDRDLVAAEVAYGRAVQRVHSESRAAEWSAELARTALRLGDRDLWWRCVKRLLKMHANPRALDSFLLGLARDGVLSGDDLEPLHKLLERHGGRNRFPGIYRKFKVQDEMDPWKKALQGIELED